MRTDLEIDCLETDWCRFSCGEHGNQIAISQRVFHATRSAEAHPDLHAKRQKNPPSWCRIVTCSRAWVLRVEWRYGLLCICRYLICAKVQQTMKTASSDEELAFKQKERDVAMYTRKAGVFIPRPSGRVALVCVASGHLCSPPHCWIIRVCDPSAEPGSQIV